jgi:hypothetical protein
MLPRDRGPVAPNKKNYRHQTYVPEHYPVKRCRDSHSTVFVFFMISLNFVGRVRKYMVFALLWKIHTSSPDIIFWKFLVWYFFYLKLFKLYITAKGIRYIEKELLPTIIYGKPKHDKCIASYARKIWPLNKHDTIYNELWKSSKQNESWAVKIKHYLHILFSHSKNHFTLPNDVMFVRFSRSFLLQLIDQLLTADPLLDSPIRRNEDSFVAFIVPKLLRFS